MPQAVAVKAGVVRAVRAEVDRFRVIALTFPERPTADTLACVAVTLAVALVVVAYVGVTAGVAQAVPYPGLRIFWGANFFISNEKMTTLIGREARIL